MFLTDLPQRKTTVAPPVESIFGNLPQQSARKEKRTRVARDNKFKWGLELPDGTRIEAGTRGDAVGLSNAYPGAKVIRLGPAKETRMDPEEGFD